MTPINEARAAVLTALSAGFAKRRFVPSDDDDRTFLNRSHRCTQVVHVSLLGHRGEVDVALDVAVRLERVEALLDEIEPSGENGDFTLGADLGSIDSMTPSRRTLHKVQDATAFAHDCLEAFDRVGRPYLERFTSERAALEALRLDTREGWLHSPINAIRAKRAAVLSLLLESHAETRELIREKQGYLTRIGDPMSGDFDDFALKVEERLASRRPS